MTYRILAPLLLLASCAATTASLPQEGPKGPARHGLELQAYPAGVVAAARLERSLSYDEVVSFRIAWNETDRSDWGEHDNEEGGGYGAGIGYSRWLGGERSGWFWGGQLDLWQLDIDWRQNTPASQGQTDVTVLQPVLQAGWSSASDGGWRTDWTASIGAEINIDTSGQDVGEGLIFLLGVRLTR